MKDEIIESLERTVEENTTYVLTLKSRYGRSNYYNLLKGYLLRLFKSDEIEPFSSSNVFLYLIFSSNIYTELKTGLGALEKYLEVGGKEYLTTQIDRFNKAIESIYSEAASSNISLLAVEVGLMKWLKDEGSFGNFISLHKKLMFIMQFARSEIPKEQRLNIKMIDYLKGVKPVPFSLNKVRLEHIAKLFAYPKFFSDLLYIFSDRFIRKPVVSFPSNKRENVMDKIQGTERTVRDRIKKEMGMVVQSIDKFSIEKIHKVVSEMEKTIFGAEAKLRGLQIRKTTEEEIIKGEQIEVPEILRFFNPELSKRIDENQEEISNLLSEKVSSVPDIFIHKTFIGKKVNLQAIIEWFKGNYNDIFLPAIVELIFEEMLIVWPEVEVRRESVEEARWIGVLARKKEPQSVFFIPAVGRKLTASEELIKDYKETVSVMVYDIRGSSIMGEKLQDAKKEDEIRNKFQEWLSEAVRKTNGFLLKDTGDGGIVFFSANSGELYSDYQAFINGSRERFSIEDLSLIPSRDAGLRAILCARKMIETSQAFVRKTLKQYKDWFKDFKEEDVEFGGISYQKLPPEYRRIFQIGVGIASGKQDIDVFLGMNVIGVPDLSGGLVRSANIYSKARHPERSVILIDFSTMCNFLFAVTEFDSSKIQKEIKSHSYKSEDADLRREVIQWMKGLCGHYNIGRSRVALERISYLANGEGESAKNELEVAEESLKVRKHKKLYDSKVGIERVVYEVLLQDRRF